MTSMTSWIGEIQWGEAAGYLVNSGLALLRVRERLRALYSRSWKATERPLCCGFGLASSSLWLKDGLAKFFHCFLELDIWLGSVQDHAPTGDVVFHQMLVQ